jgi:hypothetical protein
MWTLAKPQSPSNKLCIHALQMHQQVCDVRSHTSADAFEALEFIIED